MKECSRCIYQSCNEAEIVPLLTPLSGKPNRDILLLPPLSSESNGDLLLLPPLSSEQREVLEVEVTVEEYSEGIEKEEKGKNASGRMDRIYWNTIYSRKKRK